MSNTVQSILIIVLGVLLFIACWLVTKLLENPVRNPTETIIAIRLIAGVISTTFVVFGILNYFGLIETKESVTLHFLDTDRYVTYEDATIQRSHNNTYVVTKDGQRIQIVNAEIIHNTNET